MQVWASWTRRNNQNQRWFGIPGLDDDSTLWRCHAWNSLPTCQHCLCTMPQFTSEKYVVNQDFSNWIFSLQKLYKRNPVDWLLFFQTLLKSVSLDVQENWALKQPKSLIELAAYLNSDLDTMRNCREIRFLQRYYQTIDLPYRTEVPERCSQFCW